MNDQAKCPECGKPMPEGGAHGLCPACLMGQAMASRTLDTRSEGAPQLEPPSPEEIADKFPQFEVVECLGRGGMGVVYKARQKSLDRWVAIKVLAPERVHEERFAEHFEREAKTLAKMSHPNIVTVFDHGETGGLFYIVMEYVDGVNLRDLLREGKMEPEQALAIVPPVCEALEYAHGKGVVHRDIKPENLLLDRDGRVKIADFGIAKLVGTVAAVCDRRSPEEERQRRSQTAATTAAGTRGYIAPEQETDPGRADRRSDIYALGVVLYEMLTGERPTTNIVEPSRKVQVDVKIDEMVLRALEKEPERRYQTAGEFRTVVETIAGEPGPERPGQAPEDDGWVIRCTTCGKTRPFAETGGIRHKAASVGKRTLAFCKSCGKLRIAAIERGRAGDGELGPVAGRRWIWEPVLLVIGMFAGLALLINAKEAGGTVGVSLLFSGLVTLVVCAMGLAGIWPIPSPVLPGINFSSRNLGRPPAHGFRSRLASNLARVGVILGCLGFLGNFGSIPELSKWRVLLGLFGFFSLIGVAAMIEAFTRTRSVLGRCLVALGSVLVLLVALNFAWVLLSRNVMGPHLPGTKLVTVDLPRVSSLHLQGDPDCRYLDLDEKGSVTGLELPSHTDERTRTLNESGADLMVDLPPKMTSWSFVTPIEKPIRLAKVSMEYWKNPAILFDAAQASPASAVVDATEPAPGDLEFLQVRGGALAFAVMPSRTMWNSELHAEVVDVPQRRAPADPESNVFFFETAEGTQGMLRVSGVTFDFSEDRDGLYVDHIVFTDRFVAEMSKRGRSIGDDWGEFVDARPEPDTITEQGGYARGGVKQGPHIPIDKSGLKLTAGDLSEIAGNKEVTYLDLTDSSISDDNLASLHDLPALRQVEFSATLADTAHKPRITDAGLEHVAHWKKLRSLQLVGMPVTDEGLKSLVHLSELSSLELNSTQVRGKGLRPFRNLNWLSLVATPVRDDDLRHLAGLQNLEQLYLDLTAISDDGLKHLVGLKRLRCLNLHRTRVTAKGIAYLERMMPGIAIGWDEPAIDKATSAAPRFGPERQVVLMELESGRNGARFLDLDSGRNIPAEPGMESMPEAEFRQWMAAEGLDLFAEQIGGRWGLVTTKLNDLKLVRIPSERLPDFTPGNLVELLEQPETGLEVKEEDGEDGWRGYLLPDPIPDALDLAFRTRDGALGIMRVEAGANDTPQVGLRYKLVVSPGSGGTAEDAPGSGSDEDNGPRTSDPAAAVALVRAFKGHYAAAVQAVENGDSATAILSLKLIESGQGDLLAALAGTPIQKAIEGGLRHLHQVTVALEAGEVDRARTLMKGLDFSGPAFERMVEEAARDQQ